MATEPISINRSNVRLSDDDVFSQYSERITAFCPFLEPAHNEGVLHQHIYQLPSAHLAVLQAEVFYLGVVHTERFRQQRYELLSPKKALFCDNIVLVPHADGSGEDGRALLAWPHYLLKTLYTKAGIMFGKFWKGEEEVSRKSVPIPPPPCHFLSIRSVVKARDPYFFSKAPELLDDLVASDDHGDNVHLQIGLEQYNLDLYSVESMRSLNYYDTVLKWVKQHMNNGDITT
ncbi:MAG: hypothetical protein GFH27_549291n43 [Chloroflexi bacterium AL-W]|nr:hypothetical protein [Chloroflexi bacterium AL-N1]NOK67490.1 hypothetical protein [Chloroflexi bacterium AL-N10]NOK75018.1 hypothetical protein [Chloroflexi bacterium AL-N5]NOK81805.1 hypothetical protein [Chloroflexi bacterium AL-W]NOK89651.1 hypothetical protein [Chloroflexi bacterium AL-N15]